MKARDSRAWGMGLELTVWGSKTARRIACTHTQPNTKKHSFVALFHLTLTNKWFHKIYSAGRE